VVGVWLWCGWTGTWWSGALQRVGAESSPSELLRAAAGRVGRVAVGAVVGGAELARVELVVLVRAESVGRLDQVVRVCGWTREPAVR
jgi:hypothetical protein